MKRQTSSLALALLTAAACGGRSSKPAGQRSMPTAAPQVCHDHGSADAEASAPASQDGDDYGEPCWTPNQRDEITRLWNEIREERIAADMSPEPLTSETSRMQPMSVRKIQEDTEHQDPSSQTCISTHKLEGSICKNADSICRLAGELGNDAWASEKCNSGKASCEEAAKKCVVCVAAE